ncbi:MAG TPA: hypothetical protein VKU40_00175, partial [Thermoanaerobaculia bacterium]|nr:hypothetical protein [Thermoanaerobaculia bacterium]
LAAGRRRRGVPGWAAFAASLAPPLAVTLVVLFAAPGFGALRVALEGLRFEVGEQAVREVRVGGSPADDHLVVRDLPPGFLTFAADADGDLVATVHPAEEEAEPPVAAGDGEDDQAGRTYAMLRVGDEDAPLHNTFPLTDGDRVMAAGRTVAFERGKPGFVTGDAETDPGDGEAAPEIPRRRGFLGLRLGRELPPEVEIHPLRWYAGTGDAPLGAFVYRGGGWFGGYFRGGYRLALPTADAELLGEGDERHTFEEVAASLADGTSQRFALYRVDQEPLPVEPDDPHSRIQERRSFRARWNGGTLDLVLDTPYFVDVSRAHLDRLAQRGEGEALLAVVGRGAVAVTQDDALGYLDFPVVGEPLAGELFSRLAPDGERLRVTTHTGSREHRSGDAFAVGERTAALVRVTRMGVPWGTLLAVWGTALAAFLAGAAPRRRALPLVVLTGVELFLAVRLLIAYQGAYLDPTVAKAAWVSLAAWAMVPFVVQTALAGYRRVARGEAMPWIATLAHLAVAELAVGCALVAAGSDGFRFVAALLLPPLLAFAAGPALGWLDTLLDRLPGWRPGREVDRKRWAQWVGILLAGVLGARFLVLLVFAWKERMDLGPQLAVSVWYTPAALLVVALIWAGRRSWWSLPAAWIAWLALYLLVPVAVRDWGVLLIFSLPPLLLFALAPWLPPAGGWQRPGEGQAESGWHPEKTRFHRYFHAAPLALALLLAFVGGAVVPTGGAASRSAEALDSPAAAQELLAASVEAEANKLRLWGWAAPERLRQVGTGSAESLRVVIANLETYAGRGALGQGYLGVPLSAALTATHLDDNLSAVHVLATFGWLGALLLLAALVAWALAPFVLPAGESETEAPEADALPARRAFGLLVLWTFAAAGLYMFSANVALSLFTGKNVYLLAAASLSDAVEGTLLALLALWAFEMPAKREDVA